MGQLETDSEHSDSDSCASSDSQAGHRRITQRADVFTIKAMSPR